MVKYITNIHENMTHLYVLSLSFIRSTYLDILRIYMMSHMSYSYVIYGKIYYEYIFEHMTRLYVSNVSFIRDIQLNIFRMYMMSDVSYSYVIYGKIYYEYT